MSGPVDRARAHPTTVWRGAAPAAEAPKKKQGFATLSAARRSELAGIGGRAAHREGRAHRFTPEEARAASLKGAEARRRNRLAREQGL